MYQKRVQVSKKNIFNAIFLVLLKYMAVVFYFWLIVNQYIIYFRFYHLDKQWLIVIL